MKPDVVPPITCPLCGVTMRPGRTYRIHTRTAGGWRSVWSTVRNRIRNHLDWHHYQLNSREKSLIADRVAMWATTGEAR